jgi:transposase
VQGLSFDEPLEVVVQLRRVVAEQARVIEEQARQLAQRDRRIAELEHRVAELERSGKRQAAPFSKGEPKAQPRPPGRKPGSQYGRQATRPVPPRVDQTVVVGCPLFCRRCGGTVRLVDKASQYVVDLPPIRPKTTEYVVHYGCCQSCGRRVQGRHPEQISQALGVGAVQIGAGVLALAAYLNKAGGLSYEKIAGLLEQMLGLRVARATLCRGLKRLAHKAEATYDGLIGRIRGSPVVYPDETGWKVGGHSAWLWAFTNRQQTVYTIEAGRGYGEAASVLGEDYDGVIGADGWAPYRLFEHARLQTCLAHLQRRCREMLATATRGAVRFPRAVKALLSDAVSVRDRRDDGTLSIHGLSVARGLLRGRLERLLAGHLTHPDNRRLAKHLRRYQQAVFLFLERPDVEATNWPAEHAIRPAVVTRKACGGNRTRSGAMTQATLMSILRTCRQQHRNPIQVFVKMLRAPFPQPYRPLLEAR